MRAMKDSGVEWLGEVPEAWGLDRLGSFFSVRNQKVSDDEYAPLSVTMGGVVPQLSHVAKSDDHANRKLVCKGDFVINSRSDRRNSCGFAGQDGSVSLINTICVPRKEMDPRYFGYLFDSSKWADEFYAWGHGIVADLWTTGWNDMKKIFLPVPSVEEQARIADFLDAKCEEIDRAISAAEQSIQEYKAYKNKFTEEAIFGYKGKDFSKFGIDSGKYIPEGWKIEKLKAHATFYKGNQITKAELVSDGIAILNYGQIHSKANNGVHLSESLIRYAPKDKVVPASRMVRNDILLATTSEDRTALGIAIFIDSDIEIYPGSDSLVCRLMDIACPKYIAYQLLTDKWRNQLRVITNGIKVFHVTQDRINKTYIAIPPEQQQREIVAFLDSKCAHVEAAIFSKQAIIDELKSYKRSLIYETVTGKREV